MANDNKKIRVLHITWSGDLAGMFWDIVRTQYQDQDFDIHVCFGTEGSGRFSNKVRELGLKMFFLDMKGKYHLLSNILGALRLRKIIQDGDYDIIHLQEAIIPLPFLAAASTSPKAKIVLHNRGEFNVTETTGQRLAQWAKSIVYRRLIPSRVDRLICNSRFTVGQTPLPSQYLDKVDVLHNAIDLREIERLIEMREELRCKLRRELCLNQNAFIVTVVARLVEFKRIDRFIDGIAALSRENIDFTALIVGDGPLRQKLAERIDAKGLSGQVRLIGYRSDAKEITAASDLFVLPSSGEAFGISALEAVALGVPLVVFKDAGGPCEFVDEGENGFVVNDVMELTDRITWFARGNQISYNCAVGHNHAACDILTYMQTIKKIYFELLMFDVTASKRTF